MGKEITAAMFSTDNVYTAIGARPYGHEGVRIAYKLADYGTLGDKVGPESGDAAARVAKAKELGLVEPTFAGSDVPADLFLGVGAGTVQEGQIGSSVRMPIAEFRQPWKEMDFAFDYGLGLQALEHKEDDTIQYKAYAEKMATNFSDKIDKTLLRPLTARQPMGTDEYGNQVETSLNSIYRCIASGSEATVQESSWTYASGQISDAMVTPYGGKNSDFYSFRGFKTGTTHEVNNLDGQVLDLDGGVLTLGDVKKLKMLCQINWEDMSNPNNKGFMVSPVIQNKLGALMLANNVHLGQEYATKDFNGVKLVPGREVGFAVNTFEGIPLMMDGNIAFDYATYRPSAVNPGDMTLLDFDHIWMSTLTPIEMFTNNNPLINGWYQERNLMHMRCETRIDSFLGSGRIKNIAKDQ